jgi:Chaperone of endosialidase
MGWIKTGSVTVTNGSATVTGSGTFFVDVGTCNAGDIFCGPDGKQYEILSVVSNTGLTLASNYLGTSLGGQAYAIYPIGLLPSTLAQQVKATLTTANNALASAVRYDVNSMGLTLTQQQNARTNIAALSALDVGAGYLSKSVAGGVDVTLTAVEASAQMIVLTGALTANINVIVPVAQRLFLITNSTSGAFTVTIKTPSGAGTVVEQGSRAVVASDSTNVISAISQLSGDVFFGTNGKGDIVSAGGGNSSTYNGLSLVSNCRLLGIQSNTALQSWFVDIGGRAADGTTFKTTTADQFRIGRVAAGGSFYGTDALFVIDSSGNTLINGTSIFYPSAYNTVQIQSAFTKQLFLRNTTAAAGKCWGIGPDGSSNAITIYNQGGVGVYMTDGATSWTSSSDIRFKDIIESITNASDKVSRLRAVIGKYKIDPEGTRRSFLIAQDVLAVFPEATHIQDDEMQTVGVQYTDTIPLIVAASTEHHFLLANHESRISALEAALSH